MFVVLVFLGIKVYWWVVYKSLNGLIRVFVEDRY